MTAMITMTAFEKHLQMEQKKVIAKAYCKICQKPIGDKPYLLFEERYFHLLCLSKERI